MDMFGQLKAILEAVLGITELKEQNKKLRQQLNIANQMIADLTQRVQEIFDAIPK